MVQNYFRNLSKYHFHQPKRERRSKKKRGVRERLVSGFIIRRKWMYCTSVVSLLAYIADIQQWLIIRRQQKRTVFRKHVLWMSMQEKNVINCIKPSLYLLIFAKISPKSRNFTLLNKKNPKTLLTLNIYE